MTRTKLFCFTISFLALIGCNNRSNGPAASSSATANQSAMPVSGLLTYAGGEAEGRLYDRNVAGYVTAAHSDPGAATQQAADRKIIRNAEFTIVTEKPVEAQRKVAGIAEEHGGFVVKSEINHSVEGEQSSAKETVTVTLRLPAAHFGAALDEIRGAGRVKQEKITGQDVTEEFIDLEARLKTKKALEGQFLEIMKQAHKVEDLLDVQSKIADVRTEIEQLEGRSRFMQDRAALATITVTLQGPAVISATEQTGFLFSFKQAVSDSVDIGVGIIMGIIRLIGGLIPIVLLILLPAGLLVRFLVPRIKWAARRTTSPEPAELQ